MSISSLYRELFLVSPQPMLLLHPKDGQYIIHKVNPAYEAIAGKTKDELVGAHIFDLFPDNESKEARGANNLKSSLQQVSLTGQPHTIEGLLYEVYNDALKTFEERFFNITNIPVRHDGEESFFILHSVNEITDQYLTRLQKDEILSQLKERIKEQECLHQISRLGSQADDADDLFQKAVEVIPSGYQYPEIAAAQIAIDQKAYKSEGYVDTPWKLVIEKKTMDEEFLRLTIVYTEEKPVSDHGPFFEEEIRLAETIAENLVMHLNHISSIRKIRSNARYLSSILNSEPECVKVVSREGKLLEMNPAGLQMIEADNEKQVIGQAIKEIIYPEDYSIFLEQQKAAINGTKSEASFRIMGLKGTQRWMESSAVPLYDENGKIESVLSVTRDVTSRVKAHRELNEALQKFESLVQSIDGIFWEADAATFKFSFISRQVENILGYTPEQWLADPDFWKNHIHPDDKNEAIRFCHYKTMHGENHTFEYRMYTADGEVKWIQDVVSVFMENGKPTYLKGLMVDVTEKKLAEQHIRHLYRDVELLLQSTSDGIYGIDLQGNCTFINKAAIEILGYSKEECIGRNMHQLIHHSHASGSFYPEEKCPIFLAKDTRIGCLIEDEVFWRADGSFFEVSYSSRPIIDQDKIKGAVITFVDITEKKKADNALRKSRESLQNILDQSADVICTIDENGQFIMLNAATEKIWGYSPAELVGLPNMSLVYPEDAELTKEAANQIMLGNDVTNFENRYIRKDGTLVPMVWSARWDPQHRIMYCIARNATEKKLADLQLKMSEQRFKRLVQDGSDLIAILDAEANYIYVSSSSSSILQMDPDEFIGKNAFTFIHPDDHTMVQAEFSSLSNQNRVELKPFRFKHHDGSWRWIETVVTNLLGDPAVQGIVANSRDITLRMQAEEELKISEQKHKLLFQNSPIPKLVFEVDTLQIMDVNQSAIHHYGYGYTEFLGLQVSDISLGTFWQNSNWQQDTGDAVIRFGTSSHRKKDGAIIQVEMAGNKFDYRGRDCVILACVDVTEREQALELLKDHEQKLLTAQRIARLGYWQLDLITNTLFWSDEVYNIWGVSKDDFVLNHDNLVATVHPDDKEMLHQEQKLSKAGLKEHDLEHRIILPDGSIRWVHEKGNIVYKNGQPVFFEGTVQDTTIEKNLSLSLEISNQRYQLVSMATLDAIWDWNLETNEIFWGEGFYNTFGYLPGELQPDISSWSNHIHPEDYERINKGLTKVLESDHQYWQDEYRFKKSDGTYAFVSDKGFMIRNSEGHAVRMVGAMQDITRKKKEEEHMRLLESVITNSNDAVIVTEAEPVDEPGPRIIYVNEAFTRMTGYDKDEVIGRSPRFLQGIKSDKEELKRIGESMRKWEPCETTVINYKKNGEEFWLNFSLSPLADANGKYTHWIAIERDVTNRKNEELQKALLAEIGQMFNASEPLSYTLEKALAKITAHTSFDLAEAWLISADDAKINLVSSYPGSEKGKMFLQKTKDLRSFEKGKGLPGITWASQKIQFWKNIVEDKNFLRQQAAREAGLQAMYSIPLLFNNKVLGVLVFAQEKSADPSFHITTLFDNLGPLLSTSIRRKQLENELASIFSFAPDIICIAGLDGYFKKINPAACDLLEYTEEELLAVPFNDFIHPHDKFKTDEEVRHLRSGRTTYYFENRYITKSGAIKWLAWTASPSPNDGLLFAIAKDITEKKNLENLLDKATKMARIGSWEVDRLNHTIYWSPITREIHEMPADFNPTLEDGINFYKEGAHRDRIHLVVQDAIENGNGWDEELQIVTGKGNTIWIRSIGEAEFVNGKCTRLYGSFQDINERKKIEENIRLNNEKLQILNDQLQWHTKDLAASNKELEQFAYVASHDLQEPLRMVTSFLNQIEKKYNNLLDEKGKQYIHFAVDGARRMRQIILDLLEYSRVGRYAEEMEDVDMNDVLDDIKVLFRKQIEEKNAVIIADNLPTVHINRSPLRQVMQNIISNSLKYSKADVSPQVEVTVQDVPGFWQVDIADNGIGISEEYYERIFIIFQRLHTKTEYDGSGMGLAIVKKMVENWGGEIWLDSVEEKGTIFHFTIPKIKRKPIE